MKPQVTLRMRIVMAYMTHMLGANMANRLNSDQFEWLSTIDKSNLHCETLKPIIRGSMMRPKWLKLANLATLYFQFFDVIIIIDFKNIFDGFEV